MVLECARYHVASQALLIIAVAQSRARGLVCLLTILMRFQRRGGRKRIVTPDSSEIAPTSKPQPDGTPVKALARA
jgi:hypothetical protein